MKFDTNFGTTFRPKRNANHSFKLENQFSSKKEWEEWQIEHTSWHEHEFSSKYVPVEHSFDSRHRHVQVFASQIFSLLSWKSSQKWHEWYLTIQFGYSNKEFNQLTAKHLFLSSMLMQMHMHCALLYRWNFVQSLSFFRQSHLHRECSSTSTNSLFNSFILPPTYLDL